MIDQDKVRALVAKLRGPIPRFDNFAARYSEAADAIDLLLAEVEAIEQAILNPENQPSQYGTVLLEAAAADKRDAERYRFMRTKAVYEGSSDWTIEIWGKFASFEEALDAQIALAQRQGEGS